MIYPPITLVNSLIHVEQSGVLWSYMCPSTSEIYSSHSIFYRWYVLLFIIISYDCEIPYIYLP